MNKLLVGIIAATIIGGMAFMQPTEAQAVNCGPLVHDHICHPAPVYDRWFENCPNCGINWVEYFEDWDDDDSRWNEYLVITNVGVYDVNQKIDAISEGRLVIDIIIIGLLATTLLIGAANLATRKR